ncbi:MAG: undecaprenyl/decaprenyl-phosphate alpha-N-acetylglucosaminyl 1-phosphate transferase [Verrucomicrobiae bacterium]|nr:undecaprenyl/decaprenyl-phosphate alpha-N-acetylglucosaminyl 1-phosphate transferase [Verrucomicrobiae bacterium]
MQNEGFFEEGVVFGVTLALSIIVILLLRRFWPWSRGLDRGDGLRKLQSEPVLRVGGIAIFAVFAVSCVAAGSPDIAQDPLRISWPFFLLGATMFLLGLLDDLFGLPAVVRLLVQIVVGIGAYLCDMRIDLLTNPFGAGEIETGGFGLILTVIWFVSIPNLINLVDGMDGLAGGIALFLCITLATLGAFAGHEEMLLLNVGLVGGIVGFLVFNLPPARIYMGDGGAYLLGFAIAGSSMQTSNKGSILGALLVVIIVLGFPILDTALAMVRRVLTGLPLMRPDALHLHHRLMTLGFSKRNILFVLYGIFAGLSLLGLSVFLSAGYSLPIVGMVATLAVIQALRFLGLPHNLKQVRKVFGDLIEARKDVRYAYAMSLVLEHDLERVASAAEFWRNFRRFIERLDLVPVVGGVENVDESRQVIALRLDPQTLWIIHCPRPADNSRRWERVARCFFSAIMGARGAWKARLPADLGFVESTSESDMQDLEMRVINSGGEEFVI